MKVCLITIPSPFLLDQKVFVSLGILKVAAVLIAAGHDVDHIDLAGVTNYEDVVKEYKGTAKVFGLSATTPQMPAALRVRRVLPRGSKVILGGPHATLVHAAAKRGNQRSQQSLEELLREFDVVVAGDGEKAIFSAISPFVRGLVDADDPKSILWNTSKEFAEDPFPARHLVDMSSYHYSIDGRDPAYSILSQAGCPFHCAFCGGRNSPMLRQIRTRPTSNTVAEMMYLHETYGTTAIMDYSDELNVNKNIVSLMREIKDTGVDWRLRGFVKAELFTEEQAEAMYAAGFRWLLCGFESAHPRILRNIAKVATREDNTRMLRTAHKYGLKVKALMSIGHPAESEETILSVRDWLLEEKPDDFDVTVITVYPGTPYHDEAKLIEEPVYVYETHGDKLYWENIDFTKEQAFYKGHAGEYSAYVWTDYIDRKQLVTMRDELEEHVRTRLDIPYPSAVAAINFEHSMGMNLPQNILRSSAPK